MRTYTNMAWPEDPYRTGQQLYPRPAPRLAAFSAGLGSGAAARVTASVAVVYLPLHRTQAVTVAAQTLAFGFRAASIAGEAEAPALAALADLDLLQARRHAAVLAGYMLPGELGELCAPAGGGRMRGLSAVQREWPGRRTRGRGKAQMFDCHADLPGKPSLELACQRASLTTSSGLPADGTGESAALRHAVRKSVERALSIALICARHLGRYSWAATLDIDAIVTAAAWDCLPHPSPDRPGEAPGSVLPASQAQPGQASVTGEYA